jgi:hypothetical protein
MVEAYMRAKLPGSIFALCWRLSCVTGVSRPEIPGSASIWPRGRTRFDRDIGE